MHIIFAIPGLDLFGGMSLFSGGLAPPGSGPDPLGAPQLGVLSGSNVDLGGQFQPVDMASFGQVGSDPAMGG